MSEEKNTDTNDTANSEQGGREKYDVPIMWTTVHGSTINGLYEISNGRLAVRKKEAPFSCCAVSTTLTETCPVKIGFGRQRPAILKRRASLPFHLEMTALVVKATTGRTAVTLDQMTATSSELRIKPKAPYVNTAMCVQSVEGAI